MNGSFHIWGVEASYGRFEMDGPFENIVVNWGRNRTVKWEASIGDAGVVDESKLFMDLSAISGLVEINGGKTVYFYCTRFYSRM